MSISDTPRVVGCARDPFFIEGPACVSFSGGRTSGYMLRRILDAHGGSLPSDVHVLFANTGKERDETLDFVLDCCACWDVPITWLEYAGVEGKRNTIVAREVTHATASRKGEPYRALLEHRGYLPGAGLHNRFCTTELKIRVIKRWMRDHGYEHWTNVVGLRADEERRVSKALEPKPERWENECPLWRADITESDVLAYWRAAPFDLRLRSDEGNCDLCFLKSPAKRARLIAERPESAAWWIEQERRAQELGAKSNRFRPNEPSYALLTEIATNPLPRKHLPLFDEDTLSCACTD